MVTIPGELVRLDLPANPNVVTVARMVVAGALASARLPLGERLDDVRLAVTEACNHVVRRGLMRGAEHRVEVSCTATGRHLEIRVEATFGEAAAKADAVPSGRAATDLEAEQAWGRELMGALVDHLDLVDDEQRCAVVLLVAFARDRSPGDARSPLTA